MRQTVTSSLLAACLLAPPIAVAGGEPLCDYLQGLGSAAQARSEQDPRAAAYARAAVAARPDGAAGARARLEAALALGAGSSAAERATLLRAAAAESPATAAGPLQARLGQALAEAGDLAGALDAYRRAANETAGTLSDRSRWRVADLLHRLGRPSEAVEAWRPLLQQPTNGEASGEVRYAFALDLHAVGEQPRAAALLRAIWSDLPGTPEADASEQTLDAWRAAGEPVAPFSYEERLDRTVRLVALGRAPLARQELQRAGEPPPGPLAERSILADAFALLASGRPAEAVAAVEPLRQGASPGARRGAQVVLARAAARERRWEDAFAAWRAVASSRAVIPPVGANGLADDAEYFAALLRFETGDLRAAARELDLLVKLHPSSRRADDARWFAAWARLRAGETAEADAALKRLEKGASGERARYWRARIATDPAARAAALQAIAAANPTGYYGLLACARLRAAGAPCPAPVLPDGRTPPELDGSADAAKLEQAALLASSGLREEAVAELTVLVGQNGTRRFAPLAAELASFLGDPLVPFRVARDRLGLDRRTLAWSFPDAWPHLVRPAAAAARVDPTLLRAVMRRESAFRADVRSSAGAIGLLQIIPRTAARLSALLRLPDGVADRLADPSVNVPLGAQYLSLLLERFDEPLVAVAAYNAGPAAVERWAADRAGLPLDAWVESIPYRETRLYVRAVLEGWAGMRTATGDGPPPIDPDRPVPAPRGGVAF